MIRASVRSAPPFWWLAACDVPQAVADEVVPRAPPAMWSLPWSTATCLRPRRAPPPNASCRPPRAEEQRALARDVGVEAGTQTVANIRNLALRPAAQACFAASGVPPVT